MHDFRSVAAGESARAGPTLRRLTCGVGENGRVAEAGDEGSAVFVDKDVCLRREVMVNCVWRVCGREGRRTVSRCP